MHGGFHRSNMKRRCRWREATPISRDFANCFRLEVGEDFLKSRVVPKRIPFPACPQIGKRNAFVGVNDAPRKKGAIEKGEVA